MAIRRWGGGQRGERAKKKPPFGGFEKTPAKSASTANLDFVTPSVFELDAVGADFANDDLFLHLLAKLLQKTLGDLVTRGRKKSATYQLRVVFKLLLKGKSVGVGQEIVGYAVFNQNPILQRSAVSINKVKLKHCEFSFDEMSEKKERGGDTKEPPLLGRGLFGDSVGG